MTVILTPAYGRDYRNKKDLLADFNAGKDFIINDLFGALKDYDGKPVSKQDLIGQNIKSVNIRYKKLTQVLVHRF